MYKLVCVCVCASFERNTMHLCVFVCIQASICVRVDKCKNVCVSLCIYVHMCTYKALLVLYKRFIIDS